MMPRNGRDVLVSYKLRARSAAPSSHREGACILINASISHDCTRPLARRCGRGPISCVALSQFANSAGETWPVATRKHVPSSHCGWHAFPRGLTVDKSGADRRHPAISPIDPEPPACYPHLIQPLPLSQSGGPDLRSADEGGSNYKATTLLSQAAAMVELAHYSAG